MTTSDFFSRSCQSSVDHLWFLQSDSWLILRSLTDNYMHHKVNDSSWLSSNVVAPQNDKGGGGISCPSKYLKAEHCKTAAIKYTMFGIHALSLFSGTIIFNQSCSKITKICFHVRVLFFYPGMQDCSSCMMATTCRMQSECLTLPLAIQSLAPYIELRVSLKYGEKRQGIYIDIVLDHSRWHTVVPFCLSSR